MELVISSFWCQHINSIHNPSFYHKMNNKPHQLFKQVEQEATELRKLFIFLLLFPLTCFYYDVVFAFSSFSLSSSKHRTLIAHFFFFLICLYLKRTQRLSFVVRMAKNVKMLWVFIEKEKIELDTEWKEQIQTTKHASSEQRVTKWTIK